MSWYRLATLDDAWPSCVGFALGVLLVLRTKRPCKARCLGKQTYIKRAAFSHPALHGDSHIWYGNYMFEWLGRVICLHLECLPVYGVACLLICPVSVAALAILSNLLWGRPVHPPRVQPKLSQEALNDAIALWPSTSEARAEIRENVIYISLTYNHYAERRPYIVLSQDTLQMTVDFFNDCVIRGGYEPLCLQYFVVQSGPDWAKVDLYLKEVIDLRR